MKPINIYALTRLENPDNLSRLERQLSDRSRRLNVKSWEISSLRAFSDNLNKIGDDGEALEFYYSFSVPRLGKEFDLLRISKSVVVNVELKSKPVPDESIRHQLIQNRYYLSLLGRTVRSYTYVESENRLLRLTASDRLIEENWAKLSEDLAGQTDLYTDDIEALFKEDSYLIEPLTDPEKFLRKEYFLTSQQRDIEKKILKAIDNGSGRIFSFTGYPGTGKSMLLYDLAMKLSEKKKICLVHGGLFPEALQPLDERLHRVDFIFVKKNESLPDMTAYAALLIDEAHRLSKQHVDVLARASKALDIPLIFSCDKEDAVSLFERTDSCVDVIKSLPGIIEYRLTNRIRTNSEVSTFVQTLLSPGKHKTRREYPSVTVLYANDKEEEAILLSLLENKGYVYLRHGGDEHHDTENAETSMIDIGRVQGRDFDDVVMIVNKAFYYDEAGYLRFDRKITEGTLTESPVRELFRGLNRAKKRLAVIVTDNTAVFDTILSLMQ